MAKKGTVVTHIIAEPSIDVLDRGCMEVCPADCIDEGPRAPYTQPHECGAREPVCSVGAIFDEVSPALWSAVKGDNNRVHTDRQPGTQHAVASSRGIKPIGRLDVDTILVAGYPPRGQ